MTAPSDRDDVRELLGAYALGALDADERAQVDELLLTDPSARAELHELEQGAAWLGHASLRPPEQVWGSIAAEVEADLAADRDANVVPIRSSHPRWSRTQRWLAAAAVALVVAVGGLAVASAFDGSGSDTLESRYAAARRDPGHQTVALRTQSGTTIGRAVVLPNGVGYMNTAGMHSSGPGRDLQLWSITPDGPVSAGVFHGPGTIKRFRVAPGADELAVTDEPRGGSSAPTGAPIVRGDLGSA